MRMTVYQPFMMNVRLKRGEFAATADNDHEHCVMCGAKFSEKTEEMHCGYVTVDGRHWVCEECLCEYRAAYDWTVEGE